VFFVGDRLERIEGDVQAGAVDGQAAAVAPERNRVVEVPPAAQK
jgi:hypothetical protein